MGSYVLKDTAYRAYPLEKGDVLVFSYTLGHNKNTYPHSDRWSLTCVGDLSQTLRYIGQACAHVEDGLTQRPGAVTVQAWAEEQLRRLQSVARIDKLPEAVTLREPPFHLWMAFRERYDNEAHARTAFGRLMAQWNVRPDQLINPERSVPLLLALDRFSQSCHQAWPQTPGQDTGRHIDVLGAATQANLQTAELRVVDQAMRIQEMPNIVLWSEEIGPSHVDSGSAAPAAQWRLSNRLRLLQHFWRNVFPGHALRLAAQNRSAQSVAAYEQLLEQIAQNPPVAARFVTLQRPGSHAPQGDLSQWARLFGEDAEQGSLDIIAQDLKDHILGEMLIDSCKVAHVDAAWQLDAQEEHEQPGERPRP